MLHLDASRARQQLGWQTAWPFETALEQTAGNGEVLFQPPDLEKR